MINDYNNENNDINDNNDNNDNNNKFTNDIDTPQLRFRDNIPKMAKCSVKLKCHVF